MCKSNFVPSQKLAEDSPLDSKFVVKTSHKTQSALKQPNLALHGVQGPLIPNSSADLVAALGALGRKVYVIKPCHLFHNEYAWHVLGESSLHKGILAFKLNRIKELRMSDKFFAGDKEFDIKEHLGRAWSMIPEGRLHHVKLRFLPEVAADVAEVQWHNTQTVFFEDDGSAIIEFRVDGLGEITWWILRYGDRVQVLAPEILRRRIIEMAQNIVRQNRHLLPV
jgi:predicted DNA-binding transcriptional regulator YafY